MIMALCISVKLPYVGSCQCFDYIMFCETDCATDTLHHSSGGGGVVVVVEVTGMGARMQVRFTFTPPLQ